MNVFNMFYSKTMPDNDQAEKKVSKGYGHENISAFLIKLVQPPRAPKPEDI